LYGLIRRDANEILGIELKRTKLLTFVGSTTGLRVPGEDDRVERALRKKAARKQRAGTRPWVVALDASDTGLFIDEELVRGAERFLRNSRSISAVVLQRRVLAADGEFSFRSRAVFNPAATFPLTAMEAVLFSPDESSAPPAQ
jgi:hypothetical protein